MAEVTKRVCDIYGVSQGVRRFRVLVEGVDGGETLIDQELDLSLRAVRRLVRFVSVGLRPPGVREDTDAPDATA